MKTFRWGMFEGQGEVEKYAALIELTNSGSAWFWAFLMKKKDLYKPIVLGSNRIDYVTIRESISFVDAKEAVEKKLFDDGVIVDGDIIEDYTE